MPRSTTTRQWPDFDVPGVTAARHASLLLSNEGDSRDNLDRATRGDAPRRPGGRDKARPHTPGARRGDAPRDRRPARLRLSRPDAQDPHGDAAVPPARHRWRDGGYGGPGGARAAGDQ